MANRSFLALFPRHSDQDRFVETGGQYFYLTDTERHVQYSGETDLRAAWPQYNLPPSVPGRDAMVDEYGDCSVLADDSVGKFAAGKIRRFSVLRIEKREDAELYTTWLAPELGCFPLRSQVLVDGLVRKRVETIRLDLLPENTRLSLPKGIRVISPQAYCDLYRKVHQRPYLPARACSEYERRYLSVTERK